MINVSVLGATGVVGQRFVQILSKHPWFKISSIFASEKRRGEKYKDTVRWILEGGIPESVAHLPLLSLERDEPEKIVFSALPSSIAFDVEERLSKNGHYVFSNASSHRYEDFVPIVVPEVNPDHLEAIKYQKRKGFIVTNPNCSTAGLVIPLKPIMDRFGIERITVLTMQALSGAGFPGVPSLSILDNIIPYIEKEEEKIKVESKKILGKFNGRFIPGSFKVHARCNRVMVRDGHMEVVFVKTEKDVSLSEFKESFVEFKGLPQKLRLPTAPEKPIVVREEIDRPQPLFDRLNGDGMSVTVGRIEKLEEGFFTFTLISHNTIRGAAGGSILNLELALKLNLLEGVYV
ncbi:MAG: aspartate-semialdehyde dehydrogenase [Caldisericia bacterium]|nr:aspartate-semialdehyde dehydrogenase [Caldisericia bacterium]